MPELVTKTKYKKLLADLRRIIGEGKVEAERAATQALIESYWAIGQRISREKLNERVGYHNAILGETSARSTKSSPPPTPSRSNASPPPSKATTT
ncbi:MAG: hypothetical protein WCE62_15330 [Polyangiales bacterium]